MMEWLDFIFGASCMFVVLVLPYCMIMARRKDDNAMEAAAKRMTQRFLDLGKRIDTYEHLYGHHESQIKGIHKASREQFERLEALESKQPSFYELKYDELMNKLEVKPPDDEPCQACLQPRLKGKVLHNHGCRVDMADRLSDVEHIVNDMTEGS